MGANVLFKMEDICKSFATVKVLQNVNFELRVGEVHGLVGGNGAGKSTLMNVLGGIYVKDSGTMVMDGKEINFQKPMDSINCGIAFIHQELKLFTMRSIADNLYMSRLPTKGPLRLIDDAEKNRMTKQWLDVIELDRDPTTLVEDLSIAERQMVEIAKALSYESKLLIFDEPTSSLTNREIKTLYRIINKLKAGGTSIIYITHKFEEIFEVCDRVTVIRNGQNVVTTDVADIDADQLVDHVIGVKLKQYYPEIQPLESREVVFQVKNFTNTKLNDVSLSLYKGEILGIFGLVGAGRSELARAVFGMDYLREGELYIDNKKAVIKSPKKAIKQGIGFLTEDRRGDGLLLDLDINNNINVLTLDDVTVPVVDYVRGGVCKKRAVKAFGDFSIKASGIKQKVRFLSGGNQQKVVLAKWFLANSKVFIMDEPTRGVDIRTKSEIFELIAQSAKKGQSLLIISSEAPDLVGICHRVVVMRDGKIAGELQREEVTEEKLVKMAMGG